MPNRGGFSWKRAVGISAAKSRVSRKTGIPLTKSGRQRKAGRMLTGGGCLLPSLALGVMAALAACDKGVDLAPPATPSTTADAFLPETTFDDATPEPTVKPLPMKKVSLTSPIAPGSKAKVVVKTAAKADCSIDVEYDSGPSEAAGLDDKVASADGQVSWSWTVGRNTNSGDASIFVICTKGDAEGTLDLTFTVK